MEAQLLIDNEARPAYFLLREWLSDLGGIYLIALGTLTMVVMLFAPGGLWGLVTRRVPLQLFPVRRRVGDR